jgi:hypothetical protein
MPGAGRHRTRIREPVFSSMSPWSRFSRARCGAVKTRPVVNRTKSERFRWVYVRFVFTVRSARTVTVPGLSSSVMARSVADDDELIRAWRGERRPPSTCLSVRY